MKRSLGGTVFAAFYNPSMWLPERSGMADRRRALLAQARGEVLELGAGTGLNLAHYPAGLSRLVLTEPEPAMVARLRRHLDRLDRRADIVSTPAESLPFEDDSFDTVVATLVLCTVEDPAASLRQIRRVLRGDGQLLFLEHVRAESVGLARWQDRLQRPWRAVSCGCNCNRETLGMIHSEGFATGAVERADWRGAPPVVRPLVRGQAHPEAVGGA